MNSCRILTKSVHPAKDFVKFALKGFVTRLPRKAKNKANQNKTSTERLRSLKKSILMPRFKGGRHIYEAFLYEKGVLILIVLAGDASKQTAQSHR